MIKIASAEIDYLEKIGSGGAGTIYKKDDNTAYKIYHDKVVSADRFIDNPALTLPLIHYRRLIARSKRLKYSTPVKDVIYIDGKFRGVVIPFYEGDALYKFKNLPFEKKIELSKEILRNSIELTNHLIYPVDHKLANIMYTNGHIELIDLDDSRTHACVIPNPFYNASSIDKLGITIQNFFQEEKHSRIPSVVVSKLGREKMFDAITYKRIEEYLRRKEIVKKIIFSDSIKELESIKEYILNNGFKIVFVINSSGMNKSAYFEIISSLNKLGLSLYDFVIRDELGNYYNIENVDEAFTTINSGFKRIFKRD